MKTHKRENEELREKCNSLVKENERLEFQNSNLKKQNKELFTLNEEKQLILNMIYKKLKLKK